MSAATQAGGVEPADPVRIDTDCHQFVFDYVLKPYLPATWSRYIDMIGLRQVGMMGLTMPGAHPLSSRMDAWGPEGELPGTNPELFASQLLDEHRLDAAILNSMLQQMSAMMGPGEPRGLLAALARANNEHTEDTWLAADPRFRAAICVALEDADASVSEIERCQSNERFVQVLLPTRTGSPAGHHKYWPIYEAAEALRLPVALHPDGQPVCTGAGYQSFYYEHMCALPAAGYAQVASLIFEGVFERFPRLQIIMQEGGWSWVAPYVWRLDRAWRQLHDEVPHLHRAPSDYVREHFWFTTQPIEEPETPKQFRELWDQFVGIGMRDKLMLSTDYPHWDFDAPDKALPPTLPQEDLEMILGTNALRCYPRLANLKQPVGV